ncbi:MAG: hypothetical protein P4L46_06745 [Fimbriimonas sp.]|nr:hypothetical protein [Fimbriimonas sp.]
MKRYLLLIILLLLPVVFAIGCDSGGGGKIEPLSGQGGPAGGSKGGPHPMPGSQPRK